jgi:lipopolysaccharide/colanic/teichoic acid biosynthesis glycosyltransferase
MSVAAVIAVACMALGLAVVQKLLVSELEGWLPHVSRRVVTAAARRLPLRDQERYLEEWQAELATFDDRRLTALLWACGLLRGARCLRLELTRQMTADHASLSNIALVAKRSLDILVAAVVLVATAPLLAAVSIAIRVDSPGPTLLRQWRAGRGGEPFRIFKFRTMVEHADRGEFAPALWCDASLAGVLCKSNDDPRLTRVGRFLRRASLGELPLFFNVLLGQMSLVGPSAPIAHEDGSIVGVHHGRLGLTPGMTGRWQISGLQVPLEEKVRLDHLYVSQWTLGRDLNILLRTVSWVLWRRRTRR